MRDVLVSNKTFAAIMRVYGVEDSRGKSSADAFEMFISLLAMRSGEYGLTQWARPTFLPLIQAAYTECWSMRYARYSPRYHRGQDS